MSLQAPTRITASAGGLSFVGRSTALGDGEVGVKKTLPESYTGTLTTRTDNDTGVVTVTPVGTSHDFENGEYVDIYWAGGRRLGMLVSGVSDHGDLTVAVDGGTGEALPTLSTAVSIALCQSEAFVLDGDTCSFIALGHTGRGRCSANFVNSSNVSQYAVTVDTGGAFVWSDGLQLPSPVDGLTAIAKVFLSQEETASTAEASVAALYS